MAANGQLVFTDVDKVTFKGVGNTSNAVIDTLTGKIGVGIDSPDANLHVVGNSYVSTNLELGGTLIMGTVNVEAQHSLEAVTATGNTTPLTIEFTNPTTGIVATGNVEASKFIGDGSLLTGITAIESNVDLTLNTNNTAFINLNSNVVVEFPRSKRVIKYPKVALTQNALNNGYTVTPSTQESSSRAAWKVFNNAYTEGNGWRGTGTYSTSDGSFTGTWVDFSSGSQTISTSDRGDWLQIILPEKIRLEAIRLQPRYSPTTLGGTSLPSYGRSEFIRNGAIWGSNDGSSWDKVYTINSGLPGDTSMMSFDGINSTTAYNYFVLVITHTSGTSTGTLASFSEWELFGIPEYDPEAHGTDVTVKSYPNVPNTDWLEVYYDAKGLANGSTTVNDLKPVGTANNGTVGGNTSVTNEAFTFDGTGDYITSTVTTGTGNQSFSVACWFNFTTLGGLLWGFTGTTDGTDNSPSNNSTPHAYFNTTGSISFDFWASATVTAENLIEPNRWYAGVWTYDGTTRKIYINGIQVDVPQSSTPLSIIDNTSRLSIGIYPTNLSGGPMTGSVANFRLFNRTLTSDEIYQLYAYQKEDFGHGDLSMTLKAGRLGIGTSEPRAALDVIGNLTTSDRVDIGGALLIGVDGKDAGSTGLGGRKNLFIQSTFGGNTTQNYGWWIGAQDETLNSTDNDLHFAVIRDGTTTQPAYISDGGNTVMMNFTGQHRTFIKDVPFSQVSDLEGLIVSSDQNKYIKMSGGIEAGSNAITTNESLPVVSLSNVATDKKCFGIISASEDPEERSDAFGSFVTPYEKEKGDTRAFINSLGEGAIWVVNTNGSLESGDYITTSTVKGYGQKQDSEFLANYTVAKITMDCDFDPATQPVQVIKKGEDGENVLDEHNQIQWEDHPTETEKAYKIRYLDASGVETDEANAVHKAAFVGCTYHCG